MDEELVVPSPRIGRPFRHAAGFGRRIEYWIIGLMLKEGLDVYVPLVDDNGIDAIVRRTDGSFVEVQIKARSKDASDGALFAGIWHPEIRHNYWFIFYSECLDKLWILTSPELIELASKNKKGKNIGALNISFSGYRNSQYTCNPRFDRFLAADFKRISEVRQSGPS